MNQSLKTRHNESPLNTYRRKPVFFSKQDGWFFDTREGFSFGPFLTRQQAAYARDVFVVSITDDRKLKRALNQGVFELLDIEECSFILPSETVRAA